MAPSLQDWALPRIQQLLPLDDESLKQIIAHADTLPKDSAAEHLKSMLGDDGKSLEFISAFNLRRQNAPASTTTTTTTPQPTSSSASEVPRRAKPPPKRKANIHALPARQLQGHGDVAGAYRKASEDDYMPSRQRHKDQVADNLALREKPDATKMPLVTGDASLTTQPITAKAPPSAAGPLISASLAPKKGSAQSSRTSSPAPKAKVNISGGLAMHGASTALADLDSAIRSLEIQTNPTLSSPDDAKRKCSCMATRHPLLDMAPNCLNCGKIICVKEGLGPCTFCHAPLLSAEDMQKVLRVLKDERGEERMRANNAGHKRADVALGKARAYTGRDFLAQASSLSSSSTRPSPLSSTQNTPAGSDTDDAAAAAAAAAGDKAKAHRDRLLGFQAHNARRTRIHDEAADYDVPSAGTNMWASPVERAQQLKRQQQVLRELEWNARPDYDKRRVVASIDVKAGKVVRKMAEVERPRFDADDGDDDDDDSDGRGGGMRDGGHAPKPPDARRATPTPTAPGGGGGAFSRNPLAAGLVRPRARKRRNDTPGEAEGVTSRPKTTTTRWRRVQMDDDDNEQWLLDGGVYGGQPAVDRPLGCEEPACG